jgi:hypothetical protein
MKKNVLYIDVNGIQYLDYFMITMHCREKFALFHIYSYSDLMVSVGRLDAHSCIASF